MSGRINNQLIALYGQESGAATYAQLQTMLEHFRREHPFAALRPPEQRLSHDDVILITYGDQLTQPGRAPLRALGDLLDGNFEGVLSGVHILPFYPYTSDDGFSVVDYLAVDPALGDWQDVEALGERYRLMFDAVVNHVSASSSWFRDFLAAVPGAETRFHLVDPATDLQGITRPRTTPVLTPFQTPAGLQHVWTTFSADQIDLNFASPDLLLELTGVLLAYVAHGASLIRLDAIGYLWKQPGTSCIHLPQAHLVVQFWRAVLDEVAPDVLLITETNVPHRDNISYFGDGTNEAQLVYQFPLAPLTLHAFAAGDATRLNKWLDGLEPPTATTSFFNFLASHDGIGVVPASGYLTPSEIVALGEQVERHGGKVSYKTNPDGTISPYELNCTWFDALSDPASNEPLELKIDRFIASQALMLALQGVPGVYVHSLLGSPNDHEGFARTGRNRTLNRERWTLGQLEARLADPTRRERVVLRRMLALLRARRAEPAFHPSGAQLVLDLGPALFAVERRPPEGAHSVFCLYNLTAKPQTATLRRRSDGDWLELISGKSYTPVEDRLTVELPPYGVCWLQAG